MSVLLSNDYDHANAVLEIHPGAGGTESQDWAEMLFRMYQRYAQKNGYGFEVVDYQDGDEAGLKSCSVIIKGDMAYGYLKGESGVHRLVRISPFDANARRHTSFASVEVCPEFNDEIDIKIDEKDLEVLQNFADWNGWICLRNINGIGKWRFNNEIGAFERV